MSNINNALDNSKSNFFNNNKCDSYKSYLKRENNIKNVKISFLLIIKSLCCRKRLLKNSVDELNVYEGINYFLNKRLDVKYYIKNIIKFDKFRQLFLNSAQNLCLDFLKKESISKFLSDDISKKLVGKTGARKKRKSLDNKEDGSKITKIAFYFKNKLLNRSLDEKDNFLFQIINNQILDKIEK